MHIDLWSDFACPWCALGVRRLHLAREQFAHGDDIGVSYHAFELDPHAPARRPETMHELLASKYGMSDEQVHAGHEHLSQLGRQVGLDFQFDRIQSGNTFDAHRLASAARGSASEDAVVAGLFTAYFTGGELLSDHQVLRRVAKVAGMEPDLVERTLAGDDYGSTVRADEAVAQDRGISGVPHFVIDGTWAISGAQDVDRLVQAFEQVWERTQGVAQAGAPAT